MGTKTGVTIAGNPPVLGERGIFTVSGEIDFSDISGGVVTTDVVQVMTGLKGYHVLNVFSKIVKQAAGTGTINDDFACDLGVTGDDANGFDADIDLNAAVGTVAYGIGGTDAYVTAGGKYFASEDTIDLLMTFTGGGTVTSGKVKFIALVVDVDAGV